MNANCEIQVICANSTSVEAQSLASLYILLQAIFSHHQCNRMQKHFKDEKSPLILSFALPLNYLSPSLIYFVSIRVEFIYTYSPLKCLHLPKTLIILRFIVCNILKLIVLYSLLNTLIFLRLQIVKIQNKDIFVITYTFFLIFVLT